MFKKFIVMCLLLVGGSAAAEENSHPEDIQKNPAYFYGDIVYGAAEAPIEIIEYASFTCPHCGHFANDVFPQLKSEYIDTGKVRFIFRNFVRDRYDMAAASASRCTNDSAKVQRLVKKLFAQQEQWLSSNNPYETIALVLSMEGISKEQFGACLDEKSLQLDVVKMRKDGQDTYQIRSVPTLILNGSAVEGHSFEALKEAIESIE